MPKYRVTGVVDATIDLDVIEAPSAKEALAKAWEEKEIQAPCLCHHCADVLEVGDVYKLIVSNVDDDKDGAEDE